MATSDARPGFADLLRRAVTEPGIVSAAYSAFHNYSTGNQVLAAVQCFERGLPLGPLASFVAWKDKGRHVRRGEKAIWLWMPVTCRRKVTADDGTETDETFTRFVFKPHWFVYAQTDGADLDPVPKPGWDRGRALAALDIEEIPFEQLNGNVLGYARGRQIAVSPVNPMPHKTTYHEAAHVLLGHTGDATTNEGADLPRNLREVEAEAVAFICCESLGLPGGDAARGYVQHWLRGDTIPEANATRIFKTADAILRAGREEQP